MNNNIHIVDLANGAYLDCVRQETIDGLDACTEPNMAFLQNLKNSGVDTIIRYYSDRNNAGLYCKNITKREKELLLGMGFSIGIVYQYNGRAEGRYTRSKGIIDGEFILSRAEVIDQPIGSAIYIGVDSDSDMNSDEGVLDYFTEIKRKLNGQFKLGVYAAGSRCRLLYNIADYFWVPEAPAWDGTREFMNSGDWTFYQNKTEVNHSQLAQHSRASSIELDTNFINPAKGNTIGAFNRGGITSYDNDKISQIASKRYWVNRDTIKLTDSPNGELNGRHMCIARMVNVLSEYGDWVEIDINEDGVAEGFCKMSDLAPLGEMPRWRRGCRPMDL